jgi:hypothetical protein
LIFTSARRIARTLKRAVAGWSIKTTSRRNVASTLADECACASIAAGNTIHSARRSYGKKLIAESCRAIHAKIDIVTPANATIKIARCHGLRTEIVDRPFNMFLSDHGNLDRDVDRLIILTLMFSREERDASVAIATENSSNPEACTTFNRTFPLSYVSHHTV